MIDLQAPTSRASQFVIAFLRQAQSLAGLPDLLQFSNQLKGSVKEPNMFHNYETEKITCKSSDTAEYIELFGSSAWDRHAQRI